MIIAGIKETIKTIFVSIVIVALMCLFSVFVVYLLEWMIYLSHFILPYPVESSYPATTIIVR